MNEPTHLDLFSGIGGFSLAAEWAGFRTIAFAEFDPEAGLVLAHHWPHVPNLRDVRTIGIHSALGRVDLLKGGVPCQPASLLGKRMGSADERWLWPDSIRIVRDLRPHYCVFENPPALLSLESGRAFAGILGSLAEIGYDVLWGIIPAACVGAGHLRERVCIIASDTNNIDRRNGAGRGYGRKLITVVKKYVPTPRANKNQANPMTTHCEKEGSSFDFPSLHTMVRKNYLPTLTTRDYKDTPGMSKVAATGRVRLDQLPRVIFAAESPAPIGGMKLTPEFQCWLMGYPPSWLSPLRDALATPSSRKRSSPSSKPSEP